MELMERAVEKCGTLRNNKRDYATDHGGLVVSWKDIYLRQTNSASVSGKPLYSFEIFTREAFGSKGEKIM
jgi:hypothetical protein